jgi:hypothetical protein
MTENCKETVYAGTPGSEVISTVVGFVVLVDWVENRINGAWIDCEFA